MRGEAVVQLWLRPGGRGQGDAGSGGGEKRGGANTGAVAEVFVRERAAQIPKKSWLMGQKVNPRLYSFTYFIGSSRILVELAVRDRFRSAELAGNQV